MTWGRRDGDSRNKKLFPNFLKMQKALTENYSKAAKKIKATILPVLPGFQEIFNNDKSLFKELYKKDGSHPATPGAYLAACTFYSAFFIKDPTLIKWDAGIDAKKAETSRQIVSKVTKYFSMKTRVICSYLF